MRLEQLGVALFKKVLRIAEYIGTLRSCDEVVREHLFPVDTEAPAFWARVSLPNLRSDLFVPFRNLLSSLQRRNPAMTTEREDGFFRFLLGTTAGCCHHRFVFFSSGN
jgi:hypothetical protein